MDGKKIETNQEVVTVKEISEELDKPALYTVVILNDDYTPMDFVIEVLEIFFSMNLEQATKVMLEVHNRGQGICGFFTKEIAETKVVQVNEYAHNHQHPLLCKMEST